ncbi:hypothetical protein PISMIDRAFT_512620 [Pisolithus microcarpus 441]|uniref:Uncharacterized protein n=1 Tax=Pisolithus microcarpus 441 TaxID=765257 RepID=A0A0C9Z7V5_9AGAM|nr:hypothetical protein PISMIDRAFT_512620 [Pisolithus microcarpus 441]
MSLRSNSQDADAAETCIGVRASLWSFRRWIQSTPRCERYVGGSPLLFQSVCLKGGKGELGHHSD